MTSSRTKKGLTIGTRAPSIDTVDINGNEIKLDDLLKSNDAVLVDFFRGIW